MLNYYQNLKENIMKSDEIINQNGIDFSNLYKSLIKIKPNDPDINYHLGIQILNSSKALEAIPHFKIAFDANPETNKYFDSYFETLILLKMYDEARNILSKIDTNLISSQKLEEIKIRIDNLDNNLKKNTSSKILNSQNPSQNEIKFLEKLYQERKYTTALEKAKQLIIIFPHSIELYNIIGILNSELNNLDEALDSFNKILDFNTEIADVYNNIGNVLKAKGDNNLAIQNFNKSLKINPNFVEVFNNLGLALMNLGEVNSAIYNFEKAIKINSNFFQAYNNLGLAFKEKGELEIATKFFKKSSDLNPNYFESHYNTGLILKNKGKWLDAKQSFTNAIRINPSSIACHMNLSYVKSRVVPQWHFDMMNDVVRNDIYLEAIKLAVQKDDLVLEIGTGSGLLSMMAAENGAGQVISCESSEPIAKVAEKIIKTNKLQNKINVVNKKSNDLIVGKDLPRKADIVISEILSAEFVGEGVRSSILDANKRLLSNQGKMIPESGNIKIALLSENKEISQKVSVSNVNGFDLTEFNSMKGNKFPLHLNQPPKLLSETINAFNINLYEQSKIENKEVIFDIRANSNGVCIGLIQWIGINVFNNIKYENTPGKISSHWPTPIYLFDKPAEIIKGQIIKVQAFLSEDSVWFKLHC